MLATRDSGAYILLDLVLDMAGRRLKTILRERHSTLTEPGLFLGSGEIDRTRLAEGLLAALDQAVEEAAQTHWLEIRSPHLALGILARPQSAVRAFATDDGVPVDTLVRGIRQGVMQKPSGSKPPRLHREFVGDNAMKYLKRSAALARCRGSAVIQEKDLWRAILEDILGFVVQVLISMGISPVCLLPTGW